MVAIFGGFLAVAIVWTAYFCIFGIISCFRKEPPT